MLSFFVIAMGNKSSSVLPNQNLLGGQKSPYLRRGDFNSVMPLPSDAPNDVPVVRQRTNSIEQFHFVKTRKVSSSSPINDRILAQEDRNKVQGDLQFEQRSNSCNSVISRTTATALPGHVGNLDSRIPSYTDRQRANSACSISNTRSGMSLMDDIPENEFDRDFIYTEGQTKRKMLADFEDVCSPITDFLCVGGEKVASSWNTLEEHGITHIVNCCNMVVPDHFCNRPEMKYLTLNMVDGRQDDISWFLPQVVNFIESARLNNKKVLIHCEKGISRSCSLIIAYIMWATGDSWKDAFEFVKSKRLICAPNTGFTCNLIEIGDLLNGSDRNQPLIFRCATHLPHDMSTIVLKLCRSLQSRRILTPTLSILDQNGVFVIRPTSSIIGRTFIWQGKNAHDKVAEVTMMLCKSMIGTFLSGNSIELIKSGEETREFLRVINLDEPHNPVRHYFYFDLYKITSPPPTTSVIANESPSIMSGSRNPSRSSFPTSSNESRLMMPSATAVDNVPIVPFSQNMDFGTIRSPSPCSTPGSVRQRMPSLDLMGPLPLARDSPEPALLRTRESNNNQRSQLRTTLFTDSQSQSSVPQSRLKLDMTRVDDSGSFSTRTMNSLAVSSSTASTLKRTVSGIQKPQLFTVQLDESIPGGRHRWTGMGVYDDTDLDETAIMLLVCPEPPHYVWIGSEVDLESLVSSNAPDTPDMDVENSDEDEQDIVSPRKIRKWLSSLEPGDLLFAISPSQQNDLLNEGNILIENANEESEAFWAAFEEGF